MAGTQHGWVAGTRHRHVAGLLTIKIHIIILLRIHIPKVSAMANANPITSSLLPMTLARNMIWSLHKEYWWGITGASADSSATLRSFRALPIDKNWHATPGAIRSIQQMEEGFVRLETQLLGSYAHPIYHNTRGSM